MTQRDHCCWIGLDITAKIRLDHSCWIGLDSTAAGLLVVISVVEHIELLVVLQS